MAILNKPFPVLNTSVSNEVLLQDSTIVWNMRDFNDREYWYVEYKFADSFTKFPLTSYVNPTVIEQIRNKEVFLFLVNFHETFVDSFEKIYTEIVIKENIPAEQIVLGSGTPDAMDIIKQLSIKYNKPEINVEWFLELEWAVQERIQFINRKGIKSYTTLDVKDYPKKYLCFNRRWRLHRPSLVALLAVNESLAKGYVSLGDSDDHNDWGKIFWWVRSHNTKLTNIFDDNEALIKSIPPLYVDTQDLVTNRATLEQTTDYYYSNTYFSVITETNYYSSNDFESRGRFITEKTFKTIAQQHPFILVAPVNTLKALRQLGYQTYSPLINESYDYETDDQQRLLMIAEEVKRLSNLNESELAEFLGKAKEIATYNYNLLLNKSVYTYRMN